MNKTAKKNRLNKCSNLELRSSNQEFKFQTIKKRLKVEDFKNPNVDHRN